MFFLQSPVSNPKTQDIENFYQLLDHQKLVSAIKNRRVPTLPKADQPSATDQLMKFYLKDKYVGGSNQENVYQLRSAKADSLVNACKADSKRKRFKTLKF